MSQLRIYIPLTLPPRPGFSCLHLRYLSYRPTEFSPNHSILLFTIIVVRSRTCTDIQFLFIAFCCHFPFVFCVHTAYSTPILYTLCALKC